MFGPIKEPIGRTRDGSELRYDTDMQIIDAGFVLTDEMRAQLGGISFGGLDDQRPGLFETFHVDDTYTEIPAAATILNARQLPPSGGGDTHFLDMRAAYDLLDTEMQRRLQRLRAVYAYNNRRRVPATSLRLWAERCARRRHASDRSNTPGHRPPRPLHRSRSSYPRRGHADRRGPRAPASATGSRRATRAALPPPVAGARRSGLGQRVGAAQGERRLPPRGAASILSILDRRREAQLRKRYGRAIHVRSKKMISRTSTGPHVACGIAFREVDRRVAIGDADEGVAADALLRLRERSVGDDESFRARLSTRAGTGSRASGAVSRNFPSRFEPFGEGEHLAHLRPSGSVRPGSLRNAKRKGVPSPRSATVSRHSTGWTSTMPYWACGRAAGDVDRLGAVGDVDDPEAAEESPWSRRTARRSPAALPSRTRTRAPAARRRAARRVSGSSGSPTGWRARASPQNTPGRHAASLSTAGTGS